MRGQWIDVRIGLAIFSQNAFVVGNESADKKLVATGEMNSIPKNGLTLRAGGMGSAPSLKPAAYVALAALNCARFSVGSGVAIVQDKRSEYRPKYDVRMPCARTWPRTNHGFTSSASRAFRVRTWGLGTLQ